MGSEFVWLCFSSILNMADRRICTVMFMFILCALVFRLHVYLILEFQTVVSCPVAAEN